MFVLIGCEQGGEAVDVVVLDKTIARVMKSQHSALDLNSNNESVIFSE